MANANWVVVHDCDDEEGNPTCWVKTLKGVGVISINDVGANGFKVVKGDCEVATCLSLRGAKRYVSMNYG